MFDNPLNRLQVFISSVGIATVCLMDRDGALESMKSHVLCDGFSVLLANGLIRFKWVPVKSNTPIFEDNDGA